ncbi:hypothetical protein QFC21_003237 [Naganishia friedmannii]|uniref:Uncharacterized protein n=1 Tax=Naganishia friedmannii TaxID=89922 RepID=A0ACC2VTY2_9TREE|nr:hypothetical protein QFC21_003237 [Naganishia friedmannii]
MLLRTATATLTARTIWPRVARPLLSGLKVGSPLPENCGHGRRWNSGATAAPVLPSERERTEQQEQEQKEDPSHAGQLAKLISDSIKGYYTRKRGGAPPATSTGFDKNLAHASALDETTSKVLKQVQNDVFGRKGDFITSPEISQMFGELIGVWFLSQWAAQGQPKKVRIVELGPGRGTLLDDILRTFRAVPSFPITSLKSVDLVETSEPLRAQQRGKIQTRLNTFGGHGSAIELNFWNWIGEVPIGRSTFRRIIRSGSNGVPPAERDTFTMVLAHEFFDALPINVFQRTEDGWREVCVNFDPEWTSSSSVDWKHSTPADQAASTPTTQANSGLTLAVSREPTTLSQVLPATSDRFASVPIGGRVEISKDSFETIRMVGQLISGQKDEDVSATDKSKGAGGAGLVIDYGSDGSSSNSFRAFRRHEIVHVFDDPGSADLTANVDFAYMKEALRGAATPHGPINQRTFLTSLGLAPRLDKLLQSAKTKERKLEIANAARRLVDVNGMGGEYQFLGITPRKAVPAEQPKQLTPVYPFETRNP